MTSHTFLVERLHTLPDGLVTWWEELARFPVPLPDHFTPSNEALFCHCCGQVWARRWWPDLTCSWWAKHILHTESPFDLYDLPHFLHLPSDTQERFADDFLTHPTHFGYPAPSHHSPHP